MGDIVSVNKLYKGMTIDNSTKARKLSESRNTVIDQSSGEILKDEIETNSIRVRNTPKFVLFFLDDIAKLRDIPKSVTNVLYELLSRVTYGTNELYINTAMKKQIVQSLETSMNTVNAALTTLVKKEILIRKDKGLYLVNPFFFGKGALKDISQIRLTITYNSGDNEGSMQIEMTESEVSSDEELF